MIFAPAVVLGGYHTARALMRNLVRRGVPACCVDSDPAQPVFQSVYGPAHLCPNPDRFPDEWLAFMRKLAGGFGGRPVLICSADIYVTAVARHAAALSERYLFSVPGIALQASFATKERQYELAASNGMPVSRSRYIESPSDLQAFAATARFPCLLKPLHFREWENFPPRHPLRAQKLVVANSPEELLDCYRMASEASPRLVVQEVIEGPDTAKVVYLSCYARGGRRIAACMMRQLRTNPIRFGSASVLEPLDDPETDALCDRFLRAIGYEGLCEIELKRDTRDGGMKMIEANPRYTGSSDSAPYAGVDLGWLHYLDLTGQTPPFTGPAPRNFRHIVLTWDFPTIPSYLHEGLLTWTGLLRTYRPPVYFLDFDLRDWRVSFATALRLLRVVLGTLYRRIR